MPLFWRGFRAVLPLWSGMVPFGLAYAVTARAAGLGLFDTQLMSVLVFSGSAQFSAAGLFMTGAVGLGIVLTTFIINVRHVLYSLSLGQQMQLSTAQKVLGAHLLTDEAFGVTLASGQLSFPFLLGAELSVFVSWNLSTLVGSLLSEAVPDPVALGIDFVFPVAFLALLIPLLKRRSELIVALTSGGAALGLMTYVGSSVSVLLVGVLGSLLGAWLTRDEKAL